MKAVLFQDNKTMTINNYFTQQQPISTEVENEIFYKDIQAITFGSKYHYARIKIAHIGTNTWAFGWEIKDGRYKKLIGRDCTSNITTQGDIRKLVFGMTKVLQRQVASMPHPTTCIVAIVEQAIAEAGNYYKPD